MKILLRYCGLNACSAWQGLVEAQLKKLQGLAAIAAAHVTLERQRELAPAFWVHAELEVPGPDFHAEARDHTLAAALLKVVGELERQIRSRRGRHGGRRQGSVRPGMTGGRVSVALGG
jgi:ribosome-associated translation inhibitor RaiA